MRYLVVHAHPVEESFNKALFRLTCETLAARGHAVRGLDLYAEGFEPILSAEGRRLYHERGLNAATVQDQLDHLAWCNALVFVYPTWWYAQPAILKGWLERVWLPHECFAMPEGNQPIRPLLQHIEVLGGISTYGAPWWFTRWVGDPGRRIVLRGLKPLLSPRCRTFWCALYRMDSRNQAHREAFMAKVERRLRQLPPGEAPASPTSSRAPSPSG
ncbi:MAG: flavodoxin family protein [Geminicoccaceae bacterium]|nr:MAG: flavodoxin family protein [Geminicoccaceae bacterium]